MATEHEFDDYENLELDEVDTDILKEMEEEKPARIIERNPQSVDYVDKEKLYQAYVEWYAAIDEAKARGEERRPDPPRYLSESIINICTRLASRFNFANYPFRDEMVGDAIENIFRYADRFDLNKSRNPFGYFSRTAYWAMVRRIKYEKIRAAMKYHVLINSGVLDTLQTQDHDDGEEYQSMLHFYQNQANDSLASLIKPAKKTTRKMKKEVIDIESFLE